MVGFWRCAEACFLVDLAYGSYWIMNLYDVELSEGFLLHFFQLWFGQLRWETFGLNKKKVASKSSFLKIFIMLYSWILISFWLSWSIIIIIRIFFFLSINFWKIFYEKYLWDALCGISKISFEYRLFKLNFIVIQVLCIIFWTIKLHPTLFRLLTHCRQLADLVRLWLAIVLISAASGQVIHHD